MLSDSSCGFDLFLFFSGNGSLDWADWKMHSFSVRAAAIGPSRSGRCRQKNQQERYACSHLSSNSPTVFSFGYPTLESVN